MVLLANKYTLICRDITDNIIVDYHDDITNQTDIQCICLRSINTRKCREESAIRTFDTILIHLAVFMCLVTSFFLFYRRIKRGQAMCFSRSREKGWIRPRPHEAFHVSAGVFGALETVHYSLVLNDAYPSMALANAGEVTPYAIGASLFALYPIGIVYSSTTISTSEKPTPSKRVIDAISLFFLVGPPITLIPDCWLYGQYLDNGDDSSAYKASTAFTVFWAFWASCIFLLILSFWLQMHVLLRKHVSKMKEKGGELSKQKIDRIKCVIRQLMIVVLISVSMTITALIVAFLRKKVITYSQLFSGVPHLAYVFYQVFGIPISMASIQLFILFTVVRPTFKCFTCPTFSKSKGLEKVGFGENLSRLDPPNPQFAVNYDLERIQTYESAETPPTVTNDGSSVFSAHSGTFVDRNENTEHQSDLQIASDTTQIDTTIIRSNDA